VHVPIPLDAELKRATWFPPLFVVEGVHSRPGQLGDPAQPSLKTVRMDKDVEDLLDSDRAKPAKKAAKKTTARERAPAPEVRLSSPTKIIFPDRNITKQQVADYYKTVAPHLLREIAGRPLSAIRCPDGVGKAVLLPETPHGGFGNRALRAAEGRSRYQRELPRRRRHRRIDGTGAIQHPRVPSMGAHADDPDRADRVVFDLDPGPGCPSPR
jgi:bifunctional non-homologous end joining protein LigD